MRITRLYQRHTGEFFRMGILFCIFTIILLSFEVSASSEYFDQECRKIQEGRHATLSDSERVDCFQQLIDDYVLSNKFTCCPINTYIDSAKQGFCTTCDPGTLQLKASQHHCEECPRGEEQTFAIVVQRGENVECLYNTRGDISIVERQCERCKPGTYKKQVKCSPCFVGYYQDESGQDSCKICPKNTYNPATGATSCIQCAAGQTTIREGETKGCTKCKPGTYKRLSKHVKCSRCFFGYYQDESGQDWCKICPKGSYNPGAGATSCINCAAGQTTIREGETKGCTSSARPNTYDCTHGRNPCRPQLLTEGQLYYPHTSPDKQVYCNGRLYTTVTFYSCEVVGTTTYVGCFRDQADRDLSAIAHILRSNMTPELCHSHCRKNGYKYAGVQFKYECWCDNSHGKHGRIDESECSSLCGGDTTSKCGGPWANSIYKL